MSLKLASGDDMEVSVVRFIEESEMSEVLPEDLVELRSEVEVLEREGEVGANSEPNSAKYG